MIVEMMRMLMRNENLGIRLFTNFEHKYNYKLEHTEEPEELWIFIMIDLIISKIYIHVTSVGFSCHWQSQEKSLHK